MSLSLNIDQPRTDRIVDAPREGFFRRRVHHGGPYIPARIYRAPCTCGENGPEPHDWMDANSPRPCGRFYELMTQVMGFEPSSKVMAVIDVWCWHEITEGDYLALMQERAWDGAKED